MASRFDIIKKAESQRGVVESPRYSNLTPYGRAYGFNGQPWCAIFVWWVFKQCGIDLKKYSDNPAYTPNLWNDLKVLGWGTPESKAQPGDICFFDFAGGKNRIEHVGIIVENRYPNYVTIEGNTSLGNNSNGGAVMQRGRTAGQIVGVIDISKIPGITAGRPEAVKNPPPPHTPAVAMTLADLAKALEFCKHAIVGDGNVVTGPAVVFVQQGLNNLHIPGIHLQVDGQWGRATREAVVWVQKTRGLAADGIVGPATWKLLYP